MDNPLKPGNPFILPALEAGEVVYSDSKIKTAASLSAHYISARLDHNPDMSHRYDYDIGAFMSEHIGIEDQEENDFFSSRFAALIEHFDSVLPLTYLRTWSGRKTP